jgi:hypothetical protein
MLLPGEDAALKLEQASEVSHRDVPVNVPALSKSLEFSGSPKEIKLTLESIGNLRI